MANFDVEAVRQAIASEIDDDEVWALTATFQAVGANGDVTVQIWHNPDHGYMVKSQGEDEDGEVETVYSNPEQDPELAVQVGHLWQFRRRG